MPKIYISRKIDCLIYVKNSLLKLQYILQIILTNLLSSKPTMTDIDIPIISITTEHCSDEVDSDQDDHEKVTLNSTVNTDVENLDSESSSDNAKVYNSLAISRKKTKHHKKAHTDVEDMNDSGSDGEELKSNSELDIKLSLDEFLDHGYFDESSKFEGQNESMHDGRPIPKVCRSPAPMNLLVAQADDGGVTDCENMDGSDDDESDDNESIPENDMAMILEEAGTVESQDQFKGLNLMEHVAHLTNTDSSSSSGSSDDSSSNPFTRRNYRKMHLALSDVENMEFSDYAPSSSKSRKKSTNEEIITIEADSESDDAAIESITSPVLEVTFISKSKSFNKIRAPPRSSHLLSAAPEYSEAVTDVENLNSSDDDDGEVNPCNLKIPVAVAKTEHAILTDTEDLDGVDSEDNEPAPKEMFLGNAVRQLIMVHENESGNPVAKVTPLADHALLSVNVGYFDHGLTDTEDLSDVNEDIFEVDKYTIEKLPDIDSGSVISTDTLNRSLQLPNYESDPVTDTEDFGPTKETRKKKHKHRQSVKGKPKHLGADPRDDPVLTDCEEMVFSDKEGHRRRSEPKQKPLMVPTVTDGSKTDVEFVSGDDDDGNPIAPEQDSPPILYDRSDVFVSTFSSKDAMQSQNAIMNCIHAKVPAITKCSPTPDGVQAVTDTEEVAILSDNEEGGVESYLSRVDTSTPVAVRNDLDETSSVVHDRMVNVFDEQMERLNIKGHKDIQDAHTDVEYLEDEEQK